MILYPVYYHIDDNVIDVTNWVREKARFWGPNQIALYLFECEQYKIHPEDREKKQAAMLHQVTKAIREYESELDTKIQVMIDKR